MLGTIRSVYLFLKRNLLFIVANLLKLIGIDSKRFGPPSDYYWSLDEFYQDGIDGSKIIFIDQIKSVTIGRPYNCKYLEEDHVKKENLFDSITIQLNMLKNGRFHLNPLAVISSNDKLIFSESCCYGMDPKKHWIFNQFKLARCTNLNGSSFMLGGRPNYWHLLSEELPKLYRLSKNNLNINDFDCLLVECLKYETQKEIYDLFEVNMNKFISLNEHKHVQPDEFYFFSSYYQPDIEALLWVKKTILGKIKPTKTVNRNLFISREDCRTKRVHNFNDELYNLLNKYNFEIIKPEKMSFEEQVIAFFNSNFIIGAHGAALANLMFCSANTNVIELRSNQLVGSYSAPHVCQWYQELNDLKYSILPCEIKENHLLKGRSKMDSDIIIDMHQLEKLIQFHISGE